MWGNWPGHAVGGMADPRFKVHEQAVATLLQFGHHYCRPWIKN